MQKNRLMLTVIAVMTLCFMSSAQAQSDNYSVTAKDVKKETKELIHTLQQYSVNQRDKAVKKADQALQQLDKKIDVLESHVGNNWDNMTQSAREEARANLKALRQQRNELAELYGSFKTSSADAWEEMKKGFTDAYQAMSDSWEKAKREYGTRNN